MALPRRRFSFFNVRCTAILTLRYHAAHDAVSSQPQVHRDETVLALLRDTFAESHDAADDDDDDDDEYGTPFAGSGGDAAAAAAATDQVPCCFCFFFFFRSCGGCCCGVMWWLANRDWGLLHLRMRSDPVCSHRRWATRPAVASANAALASRMATTALSTVVCRACCRDPRRRWSRTPSGRRQTKLPRLLRQKGPSKQTRQRMAGQST